SPRRTATRYSSSPPSARAGADDTASGGQAMGCRVVRKIATGPTGPVQHEGAPMKRLRVLLSEASSLTAREHLTVLGAAGGGGGGGGGDPLALCRWGRRR